MGQVICAASRPSEGIAGRDQTEWQTARKHPATRGLKQAPFPGTAMCSAARALSRRGRAQRGSHRAGRARKYRRRHITALWLRLPIAFEDVRRILPVFGGKAGKTSQFKARKDGFDHRPRISPVLQPGSVQCGATRHCASIIAPGEAAPHAIGAGMPCARRMQPAPQAGSLLSGVAGPDSSHPGYGSLPASRMDTSPQFVASEGLAITSQSVFSPCCWV